MVDASDSGVLEVLEKCDDEAYDRGLRRWMGLGGFLGILLGVPLIRHFIIYEGTEVRLFGQVKEIVVQVDHYRVEYFAFILIFCGLGALAGRMFARRSFKPKFARLTGRIYGKPVPKPFDQPAARWIAEVVDFLGIKL